MNQAEDFFIAALRNLPPKPPDEAQRSDKQKYSQKVSAAVAAAFAAELRRRGLDGALPAPPGEVTKSGAERRISGGIGAKRVDASWSTDDSGLIAGISIKTINFRDKDSGNFQKNLTNRRGDLLFESVTLHRRFPFSVLFGFLFLASEAAEDDTDRRKSTFHNAHKRLRLFTGREDSAGREEQYERLYVCLIRANPFEPEYALYEAGDSEKKLSMEGIFDELILKVAKRNPDFYEEEGGGLSKI